MGLSAIEDLESLNNSLEYVPFSLDVPICNKNISNNNLNGINGCTKTKFHINKLVTDINIINGDCLAENNECDEKPIISLSFCITNCDTINVNSNKSNVKKIEVKHDGDNVNIDCELIEGSQLSEVQSEINSDMDESLFSPPKRKAVTVNLEIKKQKLSTDNNVKPKVLFLNTNAIKRLAHVIVQPPNYKLLKAKITDNKLIGHEINGKSDKLKQLSIDKYFQCTNRVKTNKSLLEDKKIQQNVCQVKDNDVKPEMSNNSVLLNIGRVSDKTYRNDSKSPQLKKLLSPKKDIKHMLPEERPASSARSKRSGAGSCSPKRNVDSIQFNLPLKSKSNRASVVTGKIPHFKIVAGVYFFFLL